MKRNLSPLEFDSDSHTLPEIHENSRCDTCGEEFEQPLFAAVSSGSLIEEYYACPRCLSKVGGVERSKKVEADKAEDDQPQEKEVEIEVEADKAEDDQSQETVVEVEADKMKETAVCPHYLGYLKKRQKNSPIPEGCLTCNKIIECMSY